MILALDTHIGINARALLFEENFRGYFPEYEMNNTLYDHRSFLCDVSVPLFIIREGAHSPNFSTDLYISYAWSPRAPQTDFEFFFLLNLDIIDPVLSSITKRLSK